MLPEEFPVVLTIFLAVGAWRILNIPFLLNLFQFEKISFSGLLVCTLAGFFSIVWFEIYKLSRRNKLSIV